MDIHEYQAKKLFLKYGLSIPLGYVCKSLNDIENIISKFEKKHWILKCQIHAGGRGKSGGIKIVNNKNSIFNFFKKWIKKPLITKQTDKYGKIVNSILIEEVINIKKELYLSIIVDRTESHIMFIASNKGGINIEHISEKYPELIHKIYVNIYYGLQIYQARELAFKLNLSKKQINQFINILMKLTNLFLKYDCNLIEINPLVINEKNDFVCLDTKISIDDNAKFRQKKLFQSFDKTQKNSTEYYAELLGMHYVALEGNIGCLVNGAGLAMSTMDMIQYFKGKAANFLDIGGNTTKENIKTAFKIILSKKSIKVILINIFGGIIKCDMIAESILYTMQKIKPNIPIIVRLKGNKSEIGIKKLKDSQFNILIIDNIIDAIKNTVKIAKG